MRLVERAGLEHGRPLYSRSGAAYTDAAYLKDRPCGPLKVCVLVVSELVV